MDRGELLDTLRLHLASGIGAVRFKRLIDRFGSAGRIVNATRSELKEVEGIGSALAAQIHEGLRTVDPEAELALADDAGVRIMTCFDPAYPELLKNSPGPPAVLYIRGELRREDQLSMAIVGTRRCSRYGSEQANKFGYLLSQAGLTVISGLARGIDGHAHKGAVLAGGRTIAVLGAGLLNIYPPEHRDLAAEIADGHGAVISELPMQIQPEASNFPRRNRIVAAMSLGTLVVNAPQRSGALITARMANDGNREVFSVPGPIDDPGFAGSNDLIKRGHAKLTTCLEDILDELGQSGDALKKDLADRNVATDPRRVTVPAECEKSLNATEKTIWRFLETGSHDIDTICQVCNLPAHDVAATLTLLQMKGLVKSLPGNQYSRR